MRKTATLGSIGIVLCIILVLLLFFATRSQKIIPTATIHDQALELQIATSSQEKERGLCCRDSLPENAGMLFVYDMPGSYAFWMKDTRIPLDIMWLNSEKEIVHIESNVQPASYPKTFVPKMPAQYVLETNAGYAQKYTIKIGDRVEFEL